MRNVVPNAPRAGSDVASRVARRAVASREEAYTDEVRRLLDAAFSVMRASGEVDPRVSDIVRESGLSNQAFYRHFPGKDELLLAVLEEGRRRLYEYLVRRMAAVEPGAPGVRRWIEGVMEQARNREAAARTRPFIVNDSRLRDRFPAENAQTIELLLEPLREAIADAGGDPGRDAPVVYHLTIGSMHDHLLDRTVPSRDEIEHLVDFARRGIDRAGGMPRERDA
jgi:AcrR family transcriptional regulator